MTAPQPTPSPQPPPIEDALEFAWRSHQAQETWTSRVDNKAAIFFTLNGAVLVALLAFRIDSGTYLGRLDASAGSALDLGILVCALAVAVAAVAIFPMLGGVSGRQRSRDGIYFGHLRHREPAELAAQFRAQTADERLAQLTRQLVVMARQNWFKHRILQASFLTAWVGYTIVGFTALFG